MDSYLYKMEVEFKHIETQYKAKTIAALVTFT